jgi:D-beta-D-heptose 7-phosphate kinase/D-beta-D-heptose 1-phosphate adenosyltransferase
MELLKAKILTMKDLAKRVAFWRTLGDKIVFTNGCFDILHPGHVHLLSACKQEGDRLVVGLNADVSVKRLKGETRPINNEQSRAIVLSALGDVDAVILFEEDTPLHLITALQPDVLIKGGDWEVSTIVGADVVRANGGLVKTIPYLDGHSTTAIIEKSNY